MKKNTLYSFVLIVIAVLVAGLLWLYSYISSQRETIDTATQYGYQSGGSGGTGGGSWFGGLVDDDTQESIDREISEKEAAITLKQIYNLPVAGVALVSKGEIYFTDVASGHVFMTNEELKPERVLGNTIPKIRDMILTKEGVVRRYENDTEQLMSIYNTFESETSELLAPGASAMAVNTARDTLFYLVETNAGVVGVRYDIDTKEEVPLWYSALYGWIPSWVDERTILLVQKTSNALPGYALLLDTEDMSSAMLIGGVRGLSSIARDDTIVYSQADAGTVSMFTRTRNAGEIRALPIKTLADKCVITADARSLYCAVPDTLPEEALPDAWYRGEVHFSDVLWHVDLETAAARMVLDPRAFVGAEMDIIDLQVSEDGSTIVFINKNNRTPWKIVLNQPDEDADTTATTTDEATLEE